MIEEPPTPDQALTLERQDDGTTAPASSTPVRPSPAGRPSPGERPVLPGPNIHPLRRTFRYYLARVVSAVLVRAYVRVALEGAERLPGVPCLLCFNHLNWADPFILMATLPWRPRLYFFGPREEDMDRGGRNRLMQWVGTSLAYKPSKNDLLDTTRRVSAVLRAGGVVAIAGEGRIHAIESIVLPLNDGAAYFALRAGVPIVPVAILGTSWLGLGRRVRVRVGHPIVAQGRATREAVDALTLRTWEELQALVSEQPEAPPPGPFGRWLTELFNEWPEGARPNPAPTGRSGEARQ